VNGVNDATLCEQGVPVIPGTPLKVDRVEARTRRRGGQPVASYADTREIDRPVNEAIRRLVLAELSGAGGARRIARDGTIALVACLSLDDRATSERLVRDDAGLLRGGALHLLAKRGDASAVRWMLDHGADPNARWMHWDAEVTPLHLTSFSDCDECARLLLAAGADPRVRDGKHDGDATGWAEHFGREGLRRLLQAHVTAS